MKYFILFITLLSFTMVEAQGSDFNDSGSQWPVGNVLHYKKSNWDGSHEGIVSIYFKEGRWLESAKWSKTYNQVTVIPAKINPETYSVDHLKNILCQDGDCIFRGEMFKEPSTGFYIINLGPINDTIAGIPDRWHSYDFDWTSLMVEFLNKKQHGDFNFMRYDFSMEGGKPGFGPIGLIEMHYLGVNEVEGNECHYYSINGPGLKDKGGEIWLDVTNNQLMGFRIELPDEDSYQNVDFKFLNKEQMTLEQWEEFKISKSRL